MAKLENMMNRSDSAGKRCGHHAALEYEKLPAFIAALREREAVAALALEFAILTAARSGEVMGAKWSEIDDEAKVWIVPPARMKAAREHSVPLSDRAVQIIETMRKPASPNMSFQGSDRVSRSLLWRSKWFCAAWALT